MISKVEQYNKSYKKAVALALQRFFPNETNLTVSDVLIDPSLQHGVVYLKTDPETFRLIEEERSKILTNLTYVSTRITPKLTFKIDDNYLDRIDNLIERINDEN